MARNERRRLLAGVRAWRAQLSAQERRCRRHRRLGADRPQGSARASSDRREAGGNHRAVLPRGRAPAAQSPRPVSGGVVGHMQWCADRGLGTVSHAMFGRLARWRKERIGGTVWYLDCELAEGYADLAPVQEPKALPRLGTDGKGARRPRTETPRTNGTRRPQTLALSAQAARRWLPSGSPRFLACPVEVIRIGPPAPVALNGVDRDAHRHAGRGARALRRLLW